MDGELIRVHSPCQEGSVLFCEVGQLLGTGNADVGIIPLDRVYLIPYQEPMVRKQALKMISC